MVLGVSLSAFGNPHHLVFDELHIGQSTEFACWQGIAIGLKSGTEGLECLHSIDLSGADKDVKGPSFQDHLVVQSWTTKTHQFAGGLGKQIGTKPT